MLLILCEHSQLRLAARPKLLQDLCCCLRHCILVELRYLRTVRVQVSGLTACELLLKPRFHFGELEDGDGPGFVKYEHKASLVVEGAVGDGVSIAKLDLALQSASLSLLVLLVVEVPQLHAPVGDSDQEATRH